jgi:Protein kinase domain
VYRARDTRLGRSVALKVLSEELTRDEDRKRRFFLEARAASAVTHPAIAQVYDVDEADGVAFIAMEMVPGKTVRLLLQGRELDLLGALTLAVQVTEGLLKAHEAGIVHRDLKPENIMLTPDGHAKILDFGLAKLLEPTAPAEGDEVSRMETVARTQAGMVLGTLSYMSPEQARGLAVDHRSDIFAMGVVIYEMATGQLPFSGRTPLDTLHAIAFEETRAATQVRPNLPVSLQRVLTRCLRKRPEDRYGSARELVEDLKSVRREVETGITAPVSLQGRLFEAWQGLAGRLPLMHWTGALVLGVLLLAAVGYVLVDRHSAGMLIFLGLVGLFAWRRFRNRRKRMARWLAQRLRKLPEVRVVAYDGNRITVLVDKAVARTYLRVNTLVEQLNGSMYFGEPFTVSVRDNPTPEETRSLFGSSGVLYVRQDVLEAEV